MGYIKKTWRFDDAIEVEEHHDGRYGAPGLPRKKRIKATPDQIAKRNQYNKMVRCRRKLRTHFRANDLFVTLTYSIDNRPEDMSAAKKDLRCFLRKVRRAYQKRGSECKWISNIENGTKGAWHIHLVINRINDADVIIASAWQHGIVNQRLIRGDVAQLASYITKESINEKRVRESSYSCSRNLPVKEPEIKKYIKFKRWQSIKPPTGFYLDKSSLFEGINPVTGHDWRTYTMKRLQT